MNKVCLLAIALIFYSMPSLSNEKNFNNSQENKNVNKEIVSWVENSWKSHKSFQKKKWMEGKKQIARNQEQIQNIPKNISKSIHQSALGIGEFVQSIFGINKNNFSGYTMDTQTISK